MLTLQVLELIGAATESRMLVRRCSGRASLTLWHVSRFKNSLSATKTRVPPSFNATSTVFGAIPRAFPIFGSAPLAWAVDVRAGTTDPSAFDHCCPPARTRHVPSKVLATLAAANDYLVVLLWFGQGGLLSGTATLLRP